jgi:hypothetical protein
MLQYVLHFVRGRILFVAAAAEKCAALFAVFVKEVPQ